MSFRNRVLSVIALGCVICAMASIFVSAHQLKSLGEEDLVRKSRAILSRLESVRGYVAEQGGLPSIIAELIKTHPDGKLSDAAKLNVLKQVPIFASMKVGME